MDKMNKLWITLILFSIPSKYFPFISSWALQQSDVFVKEMYVTPETILLTNNKFREMWFVFYDMNNLLKLTSNVKWCFFLKYYSSGD